MGVIFSLHFPIISKYFFFFCTLSDKNSCYLEKKCTQSKSIRKTKFGASQFSPLGKEMGMGGQSWGGFSSWCGMCAPRLEGGRGEQLGCVEKGNGERREGDDEESIQSLANVVIVTSNDGGKGMCSECTAQPPRALQ